jgi:hypothetical protein
MNIVKNYYSIFNLKVAACLRAATFCPSLVATEGRRYGDDATGFSECENSIPP